MSILTQAEIPVNDSVNLREIQDEDLIDKPLFDIDDKEDCSGDNSNVKKIFLNNRMYLKKQFIGILYRALYLLINKQPNTKRLELGSLNLTDKPV